MRLAFYGGQTAGIITLLALLTRRYKIAFVVPEDLGVKDIALLFKLDIKNKLIFKNPDFISGFNIQTDLLICCHGRQILPNEFVSKIKCINLHPCLYQYKGKHPIRRLIADQNQKASVASHWMVEQVDTGKIIVEEFTTITNISNKTESEVYRELYPIYVKVLFKTLRSIADTSN